MRKGKDLRLRLRGADKGTAGTELHDAPDRSGLRLAQHGLCRHHNNLYKGLVQELKKLEMQDQDNSDAIDKLLERIGMFPNLPTVFDGLDKLGIDS